MAEATRVPIAVPSHLALVEVTSSREQAERWALALVALSIPHQLVPLDRGVTGVFVRTGDEVRARETLSTLDREEEQSAAERAADRPPEPLPAWAFWCSQVLAGLLLVVSALAGDRGLRSALMLAGSMDGTQILLHGAWHRLVTGVTLHADGAHLLGNMVFLLVVSPSVIHRMGPGMAAAALVACGAVGNAVTLGIHGVHFGNVGASGGIFGLLGVLAVLAARLRRTRTGKNRWVLGMGAGLALLLLLGVGGPDESELGFGSMPDVVAHLGGFAAGVVVGMLAPIRDVSGRTVRWWAVQVVLGLCAAGVVALAWMRALGVV